MGIRHLNADASIEEVLEIIDQDAGVIIDNVLSQNQLDKIFLTPSRRYIFPRFLRYL